MRLTPQARNQGDRVTRGLAACATDNPFPDRLPERGYAGLDMPRRMHPVGEQRPRQSRIGIDP
jgi:hypothetical protein